MKKIFLTLTIASGLMLGACNMADDADYDAMATDMCDCVNKSSGGISAGTKDAIVTAVKENRNIETAMSEMMEKNPEQTMADANAMMELSTNMESCISGLEKKYDKVYSAESEDQVMNRILETLKDKNGCDFAYALMKLGKEEMKK
jgi:hypothetical protein